MSLYILPDYLLTFIYYGWEKVIFHWGLRRHPPPHHTAVTGLCDLTQIPGCLLRVDPSRKMYTLHFWPIQPTRCWPHPPSEVWKRRFLYSICCSDCRLNCLPGDSLHSSILLQECRSARVRARPRLHLTVSFSIRSEMVVRTSPSGI